MSVPRSHPPSDPEGFRADVEVSIGDVSTWPPLSRASFRWVPLEGVARLVAHNVDVLDLHPPGSMNAHSDGQLALTRWSWSNGS